MLGNPGFFGRGILKTTLFGGISTGWFSPCKSLHPPRRSSTMWTVRRGTAESQKLPHFSGILRKYDMAEYVVIATWPFGQTADETNTPLHRQRRPGLDG